MKIQSTKKIAGKKILQIVVITLVLYIANYFNPVVNSETYTEVLSFFNSLLKFGVFTILVLGLKEIFKVQGYKKAIPILGAFGAVFLLLMLIKLFDLIEIILHVNIEVPLPLTILLVSITFMLSLLLGFLGNYT